MKKNREAREIHGPQVVQLLRERFGDRQFTLAEVGVFKGELTEYILEQLPNAFVLMIDLWENLIPPEQYVKSGDSCAKMPRDEMLAARKLATDRTTPWHDRRSIIQLGSVQAAKELRLNVDAAFIDADHTYEAVLADIEAWWNKLALSGTIVSGLMFGHDYGSPRDVRGIWGVKRAVHEFAARWSRTVKVGQGRVWWYEWDC